MERLGFEYLNDVGLKVWEDICYSAIHAGDTSFSKGWWRNDTLPGLYNKEALWEYMIHRAQEIYQFPKGALRDPMMWHLLQMGIFNWEEPNQAQTNV
jgi:hypothetical protein